MESNNIITLSIVIPVYNGESYISDTIEAILKSENSGIELLLIDDGSLDNTAQICRNWCIKDARVRYEYIENSGIANARNRGIELANGQYICFCDQDDEMVISVYEQMIYTMTEKSATIGMCSTGRNINGDKTLYEIVEEGCYNKDDVLRKLLFPLLFRGYNYSFYEQKNYLYGTVWKCIFSLEFIKNNNIKFVSFVDYEDDWIFVTHALSMSSVVTVTDKIGYYWSVNDSSWSHEKKYISDIIPKIKAQDSYIYMYLCENNAFSKEIYEEYKKIRLCEHYVDIIENAIYVDNKDVSKKNKQQIKEYLYSTMYKKQLKCQKMAQKTVFRRRFVCSALQYFGINAAMWLNLILRWCEKNANKIQWLVKWERKGKLG